MNLFDMLRRQDDNLTVRPSTELWKGEINGTTWRGLSIRKDAEPQIIISKITQASLPDSKSETVQWHALSRNGSAKITIRIQNENKIIAESSIVVGDTPTPLPISLPSHSGAVDEKLSISIQFDLTGTKLAYLLMDPSLSKPKRAASIPARIVSMDVSRIDPFDSTEPYQTLYRETINAAQDGKRDSLQKQFRYFILYQLALQAVQTAPNLDMIECGCFWGHSTLLLARLLKANGFQGKLHVFDSFEGLSPFDSEDNGKFFNTEAEIEPLRAQFKSNELKVRELLKDFSFVEFYPGWIPDRFDEVKDAQISFLNVDVDLYKPTLQSLDFFFPRLMSGGSVYLDDYGSNNFPGARKSVDEYLLTEEGNRLIRMPFGSAFIIKA
jgi:O-methyltransferase